MTQIPSIPEAPHPSTTVEELCGSIKQLIKLLHLEVKEEGLSGIIMKKYKNCLIADLPSPQKLKMVWYFTGKLYIGNWSEASMAKSGEGIEYVPAKYFYRGQFLNDKRNGSGSMVRQGGSLYEGQWFEGEKNGRGKYYDASVRASYEGEWKAGRREGFGYFHVESQSIYEGAFVMNLKEGFGTEEFACGDSYKGEYLRGRFHGRGTYVWRGGDLYEG